MTEEVKLEAMGNTYQIGNGLFRDVRAFLNSAGLESGRDYKLTITFPNVADRKALVEKLRRDAPPYEGEVMGRASGAQGGTHGGYWQGIEYEFATRPTDDAPTSDDAVEALRDIASIDRAFVEANGGPDGAFERIIARANEGLAKFEARTDAMVEALEKVDSGEAFREQRFAEDSDADYFLRAQRNVQKLARATLKATGDGR